MNRMILRSHLLSQFDWLDHGFGTRLASIPQEAMASLKQIHSAIPLPADQQGCMGEGDALVSSKRGLRISVRTADCYPVLLVDVQRRTIAAVHAGWRGTAAGIVSKTLAAMGSNPKDVFAAIGPGIGPCCYEVGEEVGRQFGLSGRGRINLAAANRMQLEISGVPLAQIDSLSGCTFCSAIEGAPMFHSYRRDRDEAGRMISYIGLV
jgi:YfiH family protein